MVVEVGLTSGAATTIQVPRRLATYWVVGLSLTVGYAMMRGSTWQGAAQLHTFMEGIATSLALMVGAMALVRFYSKKNNTFLLIGAGFLGTAMLDGYHALVTSAFFAPFLPSDLPSLIPWSWVASRLFLSLLMCLSWLAWVREQRLGVAGQISERTVYLSTALLTLVSFLFFAFVPLPRAYYPEFVFQRPEEFVPALLFLVALVGYLRKGEWRRDAFEHWLVLSLIVGFISQAVFMSFSGQLFDLEFDAAHLLKKVSYVCVLTGLFISMHTNFRQATADRDSLEEQVEVRLRAEAAAGRSERRLRAIFKSVADGIITIDQGGLVQSFNPGAEELFGYSRRDVIGRNVKMLMPDTYARDHDDYVIRNHEAGASSNIGQRRELHGLRKDGSTFPMDLIVNEMGIEGQRMFTGIMRDITEHKLAEAERKRTENELRRYAESAERAAKKLARSNAELEQFAYVASHDLQEPLRKVQAFTDRLRSKYKTVLDEQGLDYLDRTHNAAQRMATLVSDLLSFSRITAKGDDFIPTNLDNVVHEVIGDLEIRIEETGARVEITELPTINAAPMQMRQLFQNLIGNALKYRRKGVPPVVKVVGDVTEKTCQIVVQDNGVGFEEQYTERIFGIFQRLHGRSEYDGTGVGLAICRRIAECHGGTITAQSQPGKGSVFTVTLPHTNQTVEQHRDE